MSRKLLHPVLLLPCTATEGTESAVIAWSDVPGCCVALLIIQEGDYFWIPNLDASLWQDLQTPHLLASRPLDRVLVVAPVGDPSAHQPATPVGVPPRRGPPAQPQTPRAGVPPLGPPRHPPRSQSPRHHRTCPPSRLFRPPVPHLR